MAAYSIQHIAKITNARLIGNGDAIVSNILTDSRRLISASNTIFFAIKGTRYDGHNYINELYELGVKNFVISDFQDHFKKYKDTNFIVVVNTISSLQELSAHHRKQFNIPVVGITGSNGKTIVKEWLFELLHHKKNVLRSPKSYNSQIGVPLSVWLLEEVYDIAIFEAGISKLGEMDKLANIIQPDIGLITNIGEAHQENFNSIDEKICEKLTLFNKAKLLIYCKDYEKIDKQVKINLKHNGVKTFVWSKKTDADLKINTISKKKSITHINGISKNHNLKIEIPFTDNASIENAIHVWAVLLALGYEQYFVEDKIKDVAPVAMRLELKKGINNCTLINDSYNSDFTSLQIALDFLNQQTQHPNKTVILSDILQSGRKQDNLYKDVASLFSEKKIDQIIGIGENITAFSDSFPINKSFYNTTQEFLTHITNHNFNNTGILIKGARNFSFEKISKALEYKVHNTILEINLNAIIYNLNYYRSKLKPSTKVMAMVKAFSYGSGSYEIANLLQFQRVDYLGVAFPDEGIALRKAGITLPILILNPEKSSYNSIIQNNLEPEIFNFEGLKQFSESLNKYTSVPYPIHIKIDTGMHRLGFMEKDIAELCNKLKKYNNVIVKSILSHLAASDDKVHDDFTRSQIQLFEKLSNVILKSLKYPVLCHLLNSSGIERFPEAQFNMVRLGIGLYGISKNNSNKLKNVGTLKSYVSQIKQIPQGMTVGYGRKGKIKKPTVIGIIPIGYADGLNRRLGNNFGRFIVNGKLAPIIGDICMDMCMIDITDIQAETGDEVIIFGGKFSIIDLAKLLDTIPYEILTGISGRVKRAYFQE